MFSDDFAAQAVIQARQLQGTLHDLLCTATHFVAQSVARSVERFLPAGARVDRVLLSGGGSRNGLLWRLLAEQLGERPMARTDDVGVPAAARKAVGKPEAGIVGELGSVFELDGRADRRPRAGL
jgi:anhydro-N-acetylmuramic acid kinase